MHAHARVLQQLHDPHRLAAAAAYPVSGYVRCKNSIMVAIVVSGAHTLRAG